MIFFFICVSANAQKTGEILYFMHKVAIVIPKYGLVGGAEQFASELNIRLMTSTDFQFHVFANRWQSNSPDIRFQKIPILSFPKFLTTISFAWFVRKQLQQGNFHLVHSHERIFAADLYTLHGVPHRYWVHCVRKKNMSLYDTVTAWVESQLVHRGHCQKFIAVSELTKDIFLREYPLDPDRVTVIHPGVDPTDFAQENRDALRQTIRNELSVIADEPVILFASMNFEIKGLDDILLSLARLKKQNCRFKLIVAGKGNIRKYEKLAKEVQLSDRIIFTGQLSKDRLNRLYLGADIYIMLSKFDTFGMVVLEAMAAGLPVIISGNVGAKDLVREGKNGFVIDCPGDYPYTTEKIKMLLDENVRRPMSVAALQTASQNSWNTVADKYRAIYSEILAAKVQRA